MKIENGVTNFAVYEDATEYYGMAEVTLPEITQISEEVKGAGIAGTFDGTFVGHLETMSLTLNFRSVTTDAIKLAEPRKHQLDLRAAQQSWDNSTGRYVQQAVKQRTIDRHSDEPSVLTEKLTPLIREQCAIGLNGIVDLCTDRCSFIIFSVILL